MSRSVLFVAGEGLPFIKTGGLADVIGSLPRTLAKRGHDVRVVLPLYKKIIENIMISQKDLVQFKFVLDGLINQLLSIVVTQMELYTTSSNIKDILKEMDYMAMKMMVKDLLSSNVLYQI